MSTTPPPDPPSTTPEPPTPDLAPPRRALWKRLLLACFSLVFTGLLLEGATRLFVTPPSPVLLRDGIYVGQLAKVNGRNTVLRTEGARLSEKKRPGEIRIFVFGESSIQGEPWGYLGSPPTMLHDQLKAIAPGKDITVVNMGRGAGYMIDSYYFLAGMKRFAPDYVVIYQGGNDAYRTDREMCMPATHPTLYAGWRFLVEHSRLLWTVRAEGPAWFVRIKHARQEPAHDSPDLCDEQRAFQGWADLLIETGQSMGAQVIVTTPVQNPLRWAENGDASGALDLPLKPRDKDAHYQHLLTCLLTDGCDIAAAWTEEQTTNRYRPDYWVKPRGQILMNSAAAHGATAIDFFSQLEKNEIGGLLHPLFADEVHLSLSGYWLLSWQWAARIGQQLEGHSFPADPPPIDSERYLNEITRHVSAGRACILLKYADLYLRTNMPLIAGTLLRNAVALESPAPGAIPSSRAGLEAALLVGWLRQQMGMDTGLPPSLASHLNEVDIPRLAVEIREHPDCSTVGGALLSAMATSAKGSQGSSGGGSGGGTDEYVIPPGQESVIGAMLNATQQGGCKLDEAAIQKTFIHATYLCPDGKTNTIELHHPKVAVKPIGKTARFAITATDPPPAAFIQALTEAISARESSFEWQFAAAMKPTVDNAANDAATQAETRRSPLRWILVLGVIVLCGVFVVVWRRRRQGNFRGRI